VQFRHARGAFPQYLRDGKFLLLTIGKFSSINAKNAGLKIFNGVLKLEKK